MNRCISTSIATALFVAFLLPTVQAEGLMLLAPPQSSTSSQSIPLPLPLPSASQTQPTATSPAAIAPLVEKPAQVEALPQIATPVHPDQSLIPQGLNFPGIVSALLAGEWATLLDSRNVRRYIFSVYTGMADVCGPHGDMASLDAMGYVEPGLGPGRNASEVGARVGMKLLLDLAQLSKTGDINSYLRNSTSDAPQVSEGKEDGHLISSRYGCGSAEYIKLKSAIENLIKSKTGSDPKPHDQLGFATLMSPDFRSKNGIEDPAETIRNRKKKETKVRVRSHCINKYTSQVFCDCLMSRLAADSIDDQDWEDIGFSFSNIINVASRKAPVAKSIRSCVRG